ncbi:8-oxo-dGTP pyrophosphatase MutT (NUDIX family) [Peptoniphilus olsenii]|uniref:8-oxo-dGTP pyrophosphatase MutT (NUDIX family) n=1 Tax=Peptoniphilus olsenii TaxID=411570 RepID=A0ABV2JAI5_9FIRM
MEFDLHKIKRRLKKTEPKPIDVAHKFSVFIPLIKVDGKTHLLYEKRAISLRNQPGEISFPGGRIEVGESPREAAIRETCEELLLKKNEIEIYSESDYLINPYSAIIYSFIGEIKKDFDKIKPSKDEVDEAFLVPLDFFFENKPKAYLNRLAYERAADFPYDLIPNGKNYKFKSGQEETLFYQYEDKIIWGFTAKITKNFIDKIK